jgi:hypothetical protein
VGQRAAIAVIGAAVFGAALFGCNSKDTAAVKAAPRVTDSRFLSAARAACKDTARQFDTDTTLGQTPSNAQSADFLENIDATFADLVRRLRALPVSPADQAAVQAWLADWDAYVAYGHTYAAAVRKGSDRALVQRDAASQGALRRRLRAFATANHIAECRFT